MDAQPTSDPSDSNEPAAASNRIKAVATSRQHGQVLVIFAILAPILIGMLGLGVDVAHIYKERRDMQNAVDLAALGGVSQLPGNAGAAQSIALNLASANGLAGDSVTAVAGVAGDDTRLEVTASREVDMAFMSVLGFESVTVTARAVAEHAEGKGTAIFAKKDTHCWVQTIHVPGNTITITIEGDAHSNSGMTWSGSNNTLDGKLDHGAGCESNVKMTGTDPDVPNPQPVGNRNWPVTHNPSSFPCTYTLPGPDIEASGSWWVGGNKSSKQLKPGTLCYTGTSVMTMNENGISGNVTFKARYISLSGSNYDLTPFRNGVLIHSTGLNFPSVTLNVGGRMEGMLYNHNTTNGATQGGQIDITGQSGFVLDGSIVTWAVVLRGSNWTITSTLDGTPEPMRLVE